MKSWMTSLAGIATILGALWHCYEMGKIDVNCIVAVFTGSGLLAAKDYRITGGTVAQDDKAGGPPAVGTAPVGSDPTKK